jgi:hypothetical protein
VIITLNSIIRFVFAVGTLFEKCHLQECKAMQSGRTLSSYCLHLQGQERAKQETCGLFVAFLFGLVFDPEDGGNIKEDFYQTLCRYNPKMVLITITAVRISNSMRQTLFSVRYELNYYTLFK